MSAISAAVPPYLLLVGGSAAGVMLLLLVAFLQRSKLRAERLVEALHDSEHRFRTLAASSPVGIFQLDSQGRCVYANARFRDILRVSGSLEPGWREAIHPEDRSEIESAWAGAARGQNAGVIRFRVGNGSKQRWGESRATTLRN